jgi:hypothetical protein
MMNWRSWQLTGMPRTFCCSAILKHGALGFPGETRRKSEGRLEMEEGKEKDT